MAKLGYIQVTRKCNQQCVFCSNPENENILTYEDGVAKLDELKKDGYSGVILTGGEPTLCDHLDRTISYAREIGIHPRIISNGRKLADKEYFNTLLQAGLDHIHLSIHSYKPEVQDLLSGSEHSLQLISQALELAGQNKVTVNINTVINKYNSDHLEQTVEWLTTKFPFVSHFVFNNLDPHMNRVSENPDVVPRFQDFEISLNKAANYLSLNGYTFRIERVPLCYMAEFAENSTETRKIVKAEGREVYFLDDRGKVAQNNFFYEKPDLCKICTLTPICAGVYGGEKYFPYDELYPVFLAPEKIAKKIT